MEKKYLTPEIKVVEMEATPLMAALSATAEGSTWKGLSTSTGDDEVGMPTMSNTSSDDDE